MVDISELPMEAFALLTNEHVPMSPTQATQRWKKDPMQLVYQLHAGPWAEMIQNHCTIHCLSGSPDRMDDEFVTVFIHSTVRTLSACFESGHLGRRFCFKSGMQSALHWVCHHHFA
eukprot:2207180-Amphidinium_carterae.1